MDNPILVPGGAGFIGSHVCERLLVDGHDVVALDDMSTGTPSHVAHLASHPRFRLVVHDVTQLLPAAVGRISAIVNLACPASPSYYQRDPVQTTLTSVIGIWHLLEHARNAGIPLLQASTSEVYGDPEIHPQSEAYRGHVNPIGPRACYDEGKRCAETLCFAYAQQYRTEIRVARLFNTYGPRLTAGDGRVVSNFIVQALRGEPLTVYGQGQQTRSFCYVDDTVDGLMRLMEVGLQGPVNLGNPEEHTVLELAELVLSLTGSRSTLVHRPLPADDPQRRCPDITLAREALGYAPSVSLRDGLQRTIEHFKRELGITSAPVALRLAA